MPPFIIYALPRSRTAWLAQFLSYRDWHCGHDEAVRLRSLTDLKSWLSQHNTGTVETGAAPFWRLVQQVAPEARVATLRRPIPEILASLRRIHPKFATPEVRTAIEQQARKLDQIERRIPGVVSLTYEDLKQEAACMRIFMHCLPYAHDHLWWRFWAGKNIQINFLAMDRYVCAHFPQISRVMQQARQTMLTALATRPCETAGMVIAAEPFDDFYRDGQGLIAEHLNRVGDDPSAVEKMNIPLFRALDAMGALQTVTARCNGRVFGYLISVVSPSLEFRGPPIGVLSTFYASPDAPGVGLKLQRTSIKLLQERGASEVIMRAGSRGDGPRMGAMHRRCGAVPDGEMYKLSFAESM